MRPSVVAEVPPAASCSGRLESSRVEALRVDVTRAEARRALTLEGGSRYAAAKAAAINPGAFAEADEAARRARARFIEACADPQ